jgi:hypothetical protein
MPVKYVNHNQLQRSMLLCYNAKVPVCIIGGVGCGKTTAVRDFVANINQKVGFDFHLWTVFLGLVDSTDIGGVPVRTDNNEIIYAPPKCLPFNTDKAGVILGDEYDRSDPEVQNAFNQILLGGEIHGNKISEEAFVILTMNGDSDRYTTQLSEAARNRVCTLFLSSKATSTLSQWDEWAAKQGINETIRAFAHFRPDLIKTHENFEEMAIITPRSRDMAGRILDAAEAAQGVFKTDDILLPILAGIIGHGPATELISFERMRHELPDLTKMLKNPNKYETDECWTKSSLCYAIGIGIGGLIEGNIDLAENAITLVRFMPDEIAAWAIRHVTNACPEVSTTDAYREFFDEMKDLL